MADRSADTLVDGHADARSVEAGLDALDTAPQLPPRPGLGRVLVRSVLPPVVFLALLVGVWQIAYVAEVKPPYALPGPADVWSTFLETVADGRALEAVWVSVSRGFVGFALSLVIGTLLGLLLWSSRWVRAAVGPIVSGLQSLPSVAWVPAAIIWFQLTDAAIYTVVLLGAVPSIANGLLGGFKQVPPLYDRVGRVLGLGAAGRMRHVLLPAALPGYLGGLRQGWAFAWRSLMAAELITYSPSLGLGLGQLLNVGRELSQMSLVITSIVLILVVGIAIELLVFAPVERRILRNRGLTVGG
ncbi:ABC transporter permease [Klenkia brasiliensis]|uniref:NitT/TauT family transport system permease protein n=1 Tax=Klenkia brasiliensis TaxID=333142 RepID=A0A1G7UTH7_9ACTN|nr:ABC transporter permease [Klenkia brasiliensis]SDG50776.1 NitT/TauT family transport system permease protein [Klenkia brasiliensis]